MNKHTHSYLYDTYVLLYDTTAVHPRFDDFRFSLSSLSSPLTRVPLGSDSLVRRTTYVRILRSACVQIHTHTHDCDVYIHTPRAGRKLFQTAKGLRISCHDPPRMFYIQ